MLMSFQHQKTFSCGTRQRIHVPKSVDIKFSSFIHFDFLILFAIEYFKQKPSRPSGLVIILLVRVPVVFAIGRFHLDRDVLSDFNLRLAIPLQDILLAVSVLDF